MRRYYQFRKSGDGRGGIVSRTTNFSSQKLDFSIDRHDGGFWPPQNHHKTSPMLSSCNRDYSVIDSGDSSFGVADGDGNVGVGSRTTHLSPQEVFWIDSGDFVSSWSSDY